MIQVCSWLGIRRVLPAGVFFLLTLLSLYAAPDGFRQYQSFSWAPAANARKYEVTVERAADPGSWVPEQSVQTADHRIELLLLPGNYRVAISVYNVLGKKAVTSEWIPFHILEEYEPFLFADQYPSDGATGEQVLQLSPEDVSAVNFRIQGKNIFFEGSAFSLEPEPDTGKIVSYGGNRKTVPLHVIRRDRSADFVDVSYDPDLIVTGRYKIVVTNPGKNTTYTASLPVLVKSGKPAVIDDSVFSWDNRYKVRTLSLSRVSGSQFTVRGSGFQYDTVFKMQPAEGIPYPFASAVPHGVITPRVAGYAPAGTAADMSFTYDTADIQTGYYLLTAENPGTPPASCLVLVTVTPDPAKESPEISGMKSDILKKQGLVEVTLTGKNLDSDGVGTLIAPCAAEDGTNLRIPMELVNFSESQRKVTLAVHSAGLAAGLYAVLFETNGASVLAYATVAKNYAVAKLNVSDDRRDALFLRPETLAPPVVPETVKVIPVGTVAVPFDESLLDDLQFEKTRIVSGGGKSSETQFVTARYRVRNDRYAAQHIHIKPSAAGSVSLAVESVSDISTGWFSGLSIGGTTVDLLKQGDSLRFKIDTRSNISAWDIEVSYETPEGTVAYYMDLGPSVKRPGHDESGDYYLFDYRYTDFFRRQIPGIKNQPFDLSRVTRCTLRNHRQNMHSVLSIRDMEVYDSATGIPTRLVKKVPHLLTAGTALFQGNIRGTKTGDNVIMLAGVDMTLLDFQWAAVSAGATIPVAGDAKTLNTWTGLRFSVPGDMFEPYLGAGIGKKSALDSDAAAFYYAPFSLGFRLSKMLDIRYTMELENVFSSYGAQTLYFSDVISFGITFWQRREKRYRIPVERPVQDVPQEKGAY
jgi:hypothetical protein